MSGLVHPAGAAMGHLTTTFASVLDNVVVNLVAGLLASGLVYLWRAIRRTL